MPLTQVQGGMILASGQSIPSAALPTGSVLQVVNATYSTSIATTSSTAVATGITATITPKFSTSKILIIANANGVQKSSGDNSTGVILDIYKNASTLITRFANYAGYTASSVTLNFGSCSVNFLDSPATTSATTYTVYYASNVAGQLVYINGGSENSTITLMEIAA